MEEIFEEYKSKLPLKILDDLKKEIAKVKLTKKELEQILLKTKEVYENSKIHPGESIGIITAESFGEPGTQMVLNVFHFAGVAELSVSSGLPRIIEVLDARKIIKTPMMKIFINSPHNKDPKKVRKIASMIKQVNLKEIATDFAIDISKLEINVLLNRKKMRDLSIDDENLIKVLTEAAKNVNLRLHEDKLILKPKTEENELQNLYKLKEKIKELRVSGIEKVEQVLPVKENNEFVILTAGTNLKEVMEMKDIDFARTMTNDIFEIHKVLGIEATRQAIINEIAKIYEDQGLDVDMRHMMFMADIITNSGRIRGITRSGITSEKESVLARASFETPIKHIINASLVGEEDKLNSVIENVMLNQPVPLGTGLPDLVLKISGITKELNEDKPKKTETEEKKKIKVIE